MHYSVIDDKRVRDSSVYNSTGAQARLSRLRWALYSQTVQFVVNCHALLQFISGFTVFQSNVTRYAVFKWIKELFSGS